MFLTFLPSRCCWRPNSSVRLWVFQSNGTPMGNFIRLVDWLFSNSAHVDIPGHVSHKLITIQQFTPNKDQLRYWWASCEDLGPEEPLLLLLSLISMFSEGFQSVWLLKKKKEQIDTKSSFIFVIMCHGVNNHQPYCAPTMLVCWSVVIYFLIFRVMV